jgi:1,4-dihydroxy-2-naphthoyl-CoA hydrolase
MPGSFAHERIVRFSEVDAAQVVYFSRVYEMAHEAYEALMAASGLAVGAVFANADWGMPLVHTEADYRRPWRLGERISIEGTIAEVSDRSVVFEYRFMDDAGQQRTRVSMRHAFVSLQTFKARSAPAEFAEAMQRIGLFDKD